MPRYARAIIPGGTFFLTVALLERRRDLLATNIEALRTALREVQHRRPHRIDAMVVLPEHLHAIWTLPPDDADFSTRWRLVKTAFSKQIPATEQVSDVRKEKAERGIWQRRFWEHAIRDEQDFARHVDYIHFNPVKHGHVTRVRDWPHSSFHRFVRDGHYPLDWGGTADAEIAAGE